MRPRHRALAALALAQAACIPELDEAAWRVEGTRVLAVRADPAEASPGQVVRFRALVADPSGAVTAPLTWSFCTAPKPVTENNVVTEACLGDSVAAIDGGGLEVSAAIPLDACKLFGPDPPPGDVRPRDPDITGGYYQPLLVEGGDHDAIALQRVSCNLARTSPERAREYRARYRPNQNPTLEPLRVRRAGAEVELAALPAGAELELEVGWTSSSTETFVLLDPRSRVLVERCETLTVSWFTTRGALETGRTGREACAGTHPVTNRLQVPDDLGPLTMFLVLRDDRGGVAFATYAGIVVP